MMDKKSFYDLDYIIEINEQRLEQFTSDYQKITEKLTNLILIYSVITIFLLPIIEDIFLSRSGNWLFNICFICFALLFAISVFYTVRLMIPVDAPRLDVPETLYLDLRLQYEQFFEEEAKVDRLLKASYIKELEHALKICNGVYNRKKKFYYNAFGLALLALIPYIICIGFHISKGQPASEEVALIHQKKT